MKISVFKMINKITCICVTKYTSLWSARVSLIQPANSLVKPLLISSQAASNPKIKGARFVE